VETELNIFGVYVSPFSLVLVVGAAIFLPIRAYLDRIEFGKYVWHRSLADACLYVIILGLLVLIL
jgi:hypothetical protein